MYPNGWKDFFQFTRTERNGVIGLIFLIFIALLLPNIARMFYKDEPVDFTEFEAEVEAFYENYDPPKQSERTANYYEKSWDNDDKYEYNKYDKKTYPKKSQKKTVKLFKFNPNTATYDQLTTLGLSGKTANTLINFREKGGKFYNKSDLKKIYGVSESDYNRLAEYIDIPPAAKKENSEKPTYAKQEKTSEIPPEAIVRLFTFDPNTATFDDFVTLGLSKKIAHTILNYREKDGRFYKKEDLQKMYGLTESDYARLEPYINIPKEEKPTEPLDKEPITAPEPTVKTYTPDPIDINVADIEDWKTLRGIGDYYAKKIVRFREVLGGFHSIEQVAETRGLPDSTYQAIASFLELSATEVTTFNINTVTVEELQKHPYISWKKAKTIIAYRNEHGEFGTIDDLKKVRVISPELLQKITPYLTIE